VSGYEDLREETTATELIYEGRVVRLRIDTVRLPDGSTHKREIVEHRGSVAVVPQLEDGRIVLVRQFRQATGKVLLEIPAGTLDAGESPDECASRELREETGYVAESIERLFSCYMAPGYSSERMHIYHASELREAVQQTEEDEFIHVVKVPFGEVLRMIEEGEIEDAKTICGVLGVLRRSSM